MKNYIANIVTGCRILGSILIVFLPALSFQFYIVYLLCGLSDMVDGTIARKTNSTSSFGARLDTTADFLFVAVCLIKLLPLIHIPGWLFIWIIIIAVIKLTSIIGGLASMKKLVSIHTFLNKATGLLLFLLPLTLKYIELKYSSIVVCLLATFAAIQEGYYVKKGREIV